MNSLVRDYWAVVKSCANFMARQATRTAAYSSTNGNAARGMRRAGCRLATAIRNLNHLFGRINKRVLFHFLQEFKPIRRLRIDSFAITIAAIVRPTRWAKPPNLRLGGWSFGGGMRKRPKEQSSEHDGLPKLAPRLSYTKALTLGD
jgi:hypothetical protein